MTARRFFPVLYPVVAALAFIALATVARGDEVTPLLDAPSSSWRPACKAQPVISRMELQSSAGPRRLTVHYTDTPKNSSRTLTQKLCILYRYATTVVEGTKKKLWGDIPYHYYIGADGKLGEARNPTYLVDSNTRYDREGHIAVVLEGNARDGITPAQRRKLFALLAALQRKWGVPRARIGTHKHFAQTDCPGPAILRAVSEYTNGALDPEPRPQPAPQPQPAPRPQPSPRPQPAPRPQPSPRCEEATCAPKPRCWWGKVAVNKAPAGACCAKWTCEWPESNNSAWDEESYQSVERQKKSPWGGH